MATLALGWMLARPAVTPPIVGASKVHHIQDAVNAIKLHLSSEEIGRLEEGYLPHPVLGFS